MTEEINDKLAELLLRWEEAWEHGKDIPATELCNGHPELTAALQERIDGLKKMAWMTNDATEPLDEEPDDLVSQTLGGRYRIESRIAQGGFGRVYKAFDPELERHVAIKLPTRTTVGPVEGLIEEARRVAKLRHPGIVAVHDVGTHDGMCFIVSDLIDGKSLADVISDDRPSMRDSVRLVAEIADNLQFAHDEGFIHRDIKPANILIDELGKPLLTDFGIATTSDGVDNTSATLGTLPYMAPEQVADEPQLIDTRSDIYSLGVVLYELLTDDGPYSARTAGTLREQILFRPPAPIREKNSTVSVAIETVCLKCLSKHPADRFASAAELASALRQSLVSKPASDRWRRISVVAGIVTLIVGAFIAGQRLNVSSDLASNATLTDDGSFVFHGHNRIVTPLERFAPVTLEAWIRPDRYSSGNCHFVIGSDVPGDYGIGMGICPTRLSVEYIRGDVFVSQQAVPIRTWSHIAAVFGASQTRLYFNGKHVGTAPATENVGRATFMIGNVGETNHIDFFVGKIRCVRISKGERFHEDFVPDQSFDGDTTQAVLIYEGESVEDGRILDLSGHGNDGKWQVFGP